MEAADILGISTGAVRNRINRGTLEAERESGAVYVLLPAEHTADTQRASDGYPGEYNALTSALEARIESLEQQLEAERGSSAELRRLLAAALERIPPQLEAPSEETPSKARESSVPKSGGDSPTPEERPRAWWRRVFGG
jgi:hypothetical protein